MSQIQKYYDGTVAGDIETLTGNIGGPVGADGLFNVNVLGGANITITGNPATNTLTAAVVATLPVTVGGTGQITNTLHGVLMGNAANAIQATAEPTNGQLLIGSTGNFPVLASMTNGNNITWTGGAGTLSANLTGTTNHAIQLGNATGSLTSLAVATNGQIPIGSTGADPVLATITAGANVTVTNAAGAITIAATGGLTWANTTVDANIVVGNGYIANKAGLLSMTLPAASAIGTQFAITNINTAAGWTIVQGANQYIRMVAVVSTVGAGGSLSSVALGDSIYCVCTEADKGWIVVNSMGNITIV